jgi:hypothetical protein
MGVKVRVETGRGWDGTEGWYANASRGWKWGWRAIIDVTVTVSLHAHHRRPHPGQDWVGVFVLYSCLYSVAHPLIPYVNTRQSMY